MIKNVYWLGHLNINYEDLGCCLLNWRHYWKFGMRQLYLLIRYMYAMPLIQYKINENIKNNIYNILFIC